MRREFERAKEEADLIEQLRNVSITAIIMQRAVVLSLI